MTELPNRADFDALKAALAGAIADLDSRIKSLQDKFNAAVPLADQDMADLQAAVDTVKSMAQ